MKKPVRKRILIIALFIIFCLMAANGHSTIKNEKKVISTSTVEEKNNLLTNNKMEVTQAIARINAEIEDFPELYGGVSLDGSNIIVYVTENSETDKDNNSIESLKSLENVTCKIVKCSINQLQQTATLLTNQLSNSIVSSYIDIENNQVVIIVPTKTEEISEQVAKLVSDIDIVSILEGEVKLTEQSNQS